GRDGLIVDRVLERRRDVLEVSEAVEGELHRAAVVHAEGEDLRDRVDLGADVASDAPRSSAEIGGAFRLTEGDLSLEVDDPAHDLKAAADADGADVERGGWVDVEGLDRDVRRLAAAFPSLGPRDRAREGHEEPNAER